MSVTTIPIALRAGTDGTLSLRLRSGLNKSFAQRLAEGVHDWETTTISFDPYLPDGQFQKWGVPR